MQTHFRLTFFGIVAKLGLSRPGRHAATLFRATPKPLRISKTAVQATNNHGVISLHSGRVFIAA